jgi:uracil DNA glycosylase
MTWNEYIEQESKKDYFVKMYNFLKQREQDGAVIYPDGNDILPQK